jgi:hypothetical protein
VARAKQTDRAEARRRYRLATTATGEAGEGGDDLDFGERKPDLDGSGPGRPSKVQQATGSTNAGRPGFLSSFRAAYRPANVREDLRLLPTTLRSRAFLAAVALVIGGTAVAWFFWNFSGGRMAWELLVLPGSALAPQLVVGFFAPRASYMLGFIVGILQGIAAAAMLTGLASVLGSPLTPEQTTSLLTQSFLTGPVSGALFASAAAWYRRFLALSQPKRGQPSRGGSGRGNAKSAPARRPASR